MTLQVLNELLPFLRYHEHIDTGIDPERYRLRIVHRQVVYAVPIRDNEPLKAHLSFQNLGDQLLVAVTFLPVPAAQGDHHR